MEQKTETIDISHQEIKEYDPKWVEMFEQEADRIKSLLGNKITRIEHIGSTSIPGLASKPIIDIAIEISSSEDAQFIIESLSTLGYPSSREGHDKDVSTERYLLRKGMPTEYHLSSDRFCLGIICVSTAKIEMPMARSKRLIEK